MKSRLFPFIGALLLFSFTAFAGYIAPTAGIATTNVALTGFQTIAGISYVRDSRILLTGQTEQSQNGIWVVKFGAWVRASDAATGNTLQSGSLVYARGGTAGNRYYYLSTKADPIIIGTTALSFEELGTGIGAGALASTVTVVDGTDTSSNVAIFDSATGSLACKTDAALTYNASTGALTAGGLNTTGTANRVGTATTNDALADTMFSASGATKKGFVIQAAPAQTENAFEIQASDGTAASGIRASDGSWLLPSGAGFLWSSTTDASSGSYDLFMSREAADRLKIYDAGYGTASLSVSGVVNVGGDTRFWTDGYGVSSISDQNNLYTNTSLWVPSFLYGGGAWSLGSNAAMFGADYDFCWNSGDACFNRQASGVIGAFAGGGSTPGDFAATKSIVTAGTMTAVAGKQALLRGGFSAFTWTNAQVVALGAGLAGNVKVCTLPAKTIVKNAYYVVDTAATGPTTLTASLGRVGADYLDYIVASDIKAATNTVYGDASGERGTNLTGYDLPSYTGATDIYVHFVSTVANLDQVTGSTGTVILETALLP